MAGAAVPMRLGHPWFGKILQRRAGCQPLFACRLCRGGATAGCRQRRSAWKRLLLETEGARKMDVRKNSPLVRYLAHRWRKTHSCYSHWPEVVCGLAISRGLHGQNREPGGGEAK